MPPMKPSETVNLRDGKCIVTIGAYSVADVRALSDDHLEALADYGVNNWKFRDAPAQSKAKGFVNHGKFFSFAAIVADMAETSKRESGPSKTDIEGATAKLQVWRIDLGRDNPAPIMAENATETEFEQANQDWHELISTLLEVKVAERAAELKKGQFPKLEWTFQKDAGALDNLASLFREIRLYSSRYGSSMI